MNLEKYLPIGTVILLKGGKKRIMITGFVCKEQENPDKIYDYCGLIYPEGFVKDQMLLFNHDQIEKIYYLGLNDNENKEFQIALKQIVNQQNNQ